MMTKALKKDKGLGRTNIINWDKKRSSDIKEQLGIFNINDKLTQYKINWREHIKTEWMTIEYPRKF